MNEKSATTSLNLNENKSFQQQLGQLPNQCNNVKQLHQITMEQKDKTINELQLKLKVLLIFISFYFVFMTKIFIKRYKYIYLRLHNLPKIQQNKKWIH